MKNTIKFLGIIAIVAIIGFSIAGCKADEEEEPSLDGTWGDYDSDGKLGKYKFDNGNWEVEVFGKPAMKGTYTINGDTLTRYVTHIYGDGLYAIFVTFPEKDAWYNKEEYANYAGSSYTAEAVDETFAPMICTFSVDGNTLTLTDEKGATKFKKL
jgi:hypothetical protein